MRFLIGIRGLLNRPLTTTVPFFPCHLFFSCQLLTHRSNVYTKVKTSFKLFPTTVMSQVGHHQENVITVTMMSLQMKPPAMSCVPRHNAYRQYFYYLQKFKQRPEQLTEQLIENKDDVNIYDGQKERKAATTRKRLRPPYDKPAPTSANCNRKRHFEEQQQEHRGNDGDDEEWKYEGGRKRSMITPAEIAENGGRGLKRRQCTVTSTVLLRGNNSSGEEVSTSTSTIMAINIDSNNNKANTTKTKNINHPTDDNNNNNVDTNTTTSTDGNFNDDENRNAVTEATTVGQRHQTRLYSIKAVCPSLHADVPTYDNGESSSMSISRFIKDPIEEVVRKGRTKIHWTVERRWRFLKLFSRHGKNFKLITELLNESGPYVALRSVVMFYYKEKLFLGLKQFVTGKGKERKKCKKKKDGNGLPTGNEMGSERENERNIQDAKLYDLAVHSYLRACDRTASTS